MNKKIKPFADRILVLPKEAEKITKGGIIIPSLAQEKPNQGTIISIGDTVPEHVQVGMEILYAKHAGAPVKVKEVEHSLMKVSEIMAILED